MSFNILTSFLPDDEAERLYKKHPDIGQSPETYCPTCLLERTFVWREQRYQCNCAQQLQLQKHYLAAGIGIPYQRLDWDDFEGADAIVEQLSKYLFDHGRYISRGVGLFLSGPVGTGKTMLANLVLKELVKKGYSCFATTFNQTMDFFTAGWHNADDQEYFRRKFLRSRVLLLDDIGKEMRTKLTNSTLDAILRTRVQEGNPTFITTNLSSAEMESGYGAGILSLLKESSIYYEFPPEDDFRPRSHQRTLDEIRSGETRPIF